MLSRCVHVWFSIVDHPRCAMCHRYSQPAKVFCSHDCKLKLEALNLSTADMRRSLLKRLSRHLICDSATSRGDYDRVLPRPPATPST